MNRDMLPLPLGEALRKLTEEGIICGMNLNLNSLYLYEMNQYRIPMNHPILLCLPYMSFSQNEIPPLGFHVCNQGMQSKTNLILFQF